LRLRAVVLAAGLGTRLRPLTGTEPKPALPVAGVPVAGRSLALLARAGCEAAAVNLHHLGDRLRAALGESVAGMPLVYSREEEVQGTLGALWPLRDFCAAADVLLVINGDSLCRWPLARLLRAHRRGGAAATLLLSSRADPADFGGGVGVGRDGGIVTFDRAPAPAVARRRVFAGAHAIAPRLLRRLAAGPADFIADLYRPLVERGERIAAIETRRLWQDLGTPERYRRAVLDHLFRRRPWRRRWIGQGARVGSDARLSRAAVEAGAAVGRAARLRRTLVLPGARVGREAVLKNCLVGFEARVPDGAEIGGQLITPAAGGQDGGSRVGDLVFTPLA
jgi:mannose-1-phosphate guanylyltransferase